MADPADSLSSRQRDVVALFRIMPAADVAKAMGLTRAAVAALLLGVRRKMRARTSVEAMDKLGMPIDPFSRLTASERSYLDLLCTGMPVAEIAAIRGVSVQAVGMALASAARRLGVTGHVALALAYNRRVQQDL